MTFLPAALQLAGTVIGAVGTVYSGLATAQQARYQAAVAEINANTARENARRALERSQLEQDDQDAQTLALIGQQEAAQSASGLSITGRSAFLARKSALELGRRDALNVRDAGKLEAYNYEVQATNQSNAAALYRQQGRNSMVAGFLGGAQSLIGGAGKFMEDQEIRYGTPRRILR